MATYLTVEQAAERANVTTRTIHNWFKMGLEYEKKRIIGRRGQPQRVIKLSVFKAFLRDGF